MGPVTELVAGSLVGGNGLDSIAVADPVEVAAPDVGVDDGEAPSTGCNFTNKGVVVGLGGGVSRSRIFLTILVRTCWPSSTSFRN
eukprot:scaffold13408_cov154-Amphora_coffeaeformis.AAC.2